MKIGSEDRDVDVSVRRMYGSWSDFVVHEDLICTVKIGSENRSRLGALLEMVWDGTGLVSACWLAGLKSKYNRCQPAVLKSEYDRDVVAYERDGMKVLV